MLSREIVRGHKGPLGLITGGLLLLVHNQYSALEIGGARASCHNWSGNELFVAWEPAAGETHGKMGEVLGVSGQDSVHVQRKNCRTGLGEEILRRMPSKDMQIPSAQSRAGA